MKNLVGPTSPESAIKHGGDYHRLGTSQAFPIYGSSGGTGAPAKLRAPVARAVISDEAARALTNPTGSGKPRVPARSAHITEEAARALINPAGVSNGAANPLKAQVKVFASPAEAALHKDLPGATSSKSSGLLSKIAAGIEKIPGGDKLLAWGSRAAPALKVLGPIAGAATGAWDTYKSINEGDTGRAVYSGTATALIVAGGAASLTGIGAVAGVPMMAIGGAMMVGQMAYDGAKTIGNWLGFGKKDEDQAQKRNEEAAKQANKAPAGAVKVANNLVAEDGVVHRDDDRFVDDPEKKRGHRTTDGKFDHRHGDKPDKPGETYNAFSNAIDTKNVNSFGEGKTGVETADAGRSFQPIMVHRAVAQADTADKATPGTRDQKSATTRQTQNLTV